MTAARSDSTEGVPGTDPVSLSAAIFRYRSDWNAFLSASLEDPNSGDDLAASFKPSMKVIETWTRPAKSQQEAALALQLALEDYEMGETPRVSAMVKAALGFLESEPGTEAVPALGEMEDDVRRSVYMATILDNMLDQRFSDIPRDGSDLLLRMSRREIDMYSFAWKEVRHLAENVQQNFYAILEGRTL